MRVLISGGGVAGLTLAWWLARFGHEPLIVEQAPSVRGDGYMIDFFGVGYDVAERMQILPALREIHCEIPELRFLDERGQLQVALDYARVRTRIFGGRHFSFMRGDLERVLFEQVGDRVEVRFGTSVSALDQHMDAIDVLLSDGTSERVALVVGADGVHSRVRELAFGDESEFTVFLGYAAAAYILDRSAVPAMDESVFSTVTSPNRQVGVYPIHDGRLAAFFLHKADHAPSRVPSPAPHDTVCDHLSNAFGDLGWIVPDLVAACSAADSVYCEAVEQVQIPWWRSGRVVLVGDACYCVSLLAGQGASLAMAGAYVLASELRDTGNGVLSALARYQWRLEPTMTRHRDSALRIARWLAPGSRLQIAVRNMFLRASLWPGVSALMRAEFAPDDVLDPPRPSV